MVVVAPRRSVERIPIDGITIRNEWYASVKHWISFPVALLLLIVLAPVFAVGALAVKLTSRGPAFKRQTRVGRNGQLFSISPAVARWRRFIVVAGATMLITGASIGIAAAVDFPALEPVAIVKATPVSGTAPLTVTFDGSASTGPNTLVSWAWTFGDGTVGSGAMTTHTYTTPGRYFASLVVSDALGLHSFPRTVQIDVAARVAPGAPLNLVATAASRSSIILTWTNATTDQSCVRVERCKGTDCTRFSLVKTLVGTATSFTDTKLSPGTTYVYRVQSANAVGTSLYSNLASGRTLK